MYQRPTSAEEWRLIPGVPGYQVSSYGSVYSNKTQRELRTSGLRYPQVTLHRDGERITRTVHSLVAEAFIGPRPAGREVRHLDGNERNPRLDNLAYGTPSENAQDRLRHGTDQNGRKTHCKHGHPFNEANTYVPKDRNARVCRICVNARSRAHRQARTGEVAA